MRTISEVEIRSIKSATEAAYTLGGGVTAFPELTRVNVSTLSKYASFNADLSESVIPCDVAVEADRRAKSPVITSAMARALGYRLEPIRDQLEQHGEITEADAVNIISEAMDVSKEIIKARQDGKIDALERKSLLRELRELVRAAEVLIAKLEEGGGN